MHPTLISRKGYADRLRLTDADMPVNSTKHTTVTFISTTSIDLIHRTTASASYPRPASPTRLPSLSQDLCAKYPDNDYDARYVEPGAREMMFCGSRVARVGTGSVWRKPKPKYSRCACQASPGPGCHGRSHSTVLALALAPRRTETKDGHAREGFELR